MKPADENRLLSSVLLRGYYAPVASVLACVVGWAAYAYLYQLRHGLGVTGMRDRIPWGLYIVDFVFFIGISHAGTLISAILRVTGAEWRRPITRMAEVITAVALMTGALLPIIDLGNAVNIPNLVTRGRLQSPILWDLVSITTYLTGSLIYLYLPMIPDLAMLRDRMSGQVGSFRRWLYRWLSIGWQDTPQQRRRLERVLSIMCILIIPIAISVHTVVSWIFAMTTRTGWRSTAFGPYFVIGAIFSGIGALVTAMSAFRKMYHLENELTEDHFKKLGWLMLTANLLYIYFTFAEYLTTAYAATPDEKLLLQLLFVGKYALPFWIFAIGGCIVPALMVALPWTRNITGITIASVLVNVGMWLKRFVIVIPSLSVPLMPYEYMNYRPTWVEYSITVGAFAWFLLLYLTFARFMPIMAVWEMSTDTQAHPETAHTADGVAAAVALPIGDVAMAGGASDD